MEDIINCVEAYEPEPWLCPMEPSSIIGPPKFTYGEQRQYGDVKAPHLGIDLTAPEGTLLAMPFAGKVVAVRSGGGWGNRVYMKARHSEDYVAYCHCKRIWADIGDEYERGASVAAVGSTGNSTGPHLHLMVSGIFKFWWPEDPYMALAYLKNPRYLFDFGGAR
jgi:murein DD-endopeptidase MepM/ murein hydrolase activator NlpD